MAVLHGRGRLGGVEVDSDGGLLVAGRVEVD